MCPRRPPHGIFVQQVIYREARRLLRKSPISRYFAYHDMGCRGVQAVLSAG